MKYIIRGKLKIFRGFDKDTKLVVTESLSDASIYNTFEDADRILKENHSSQMLVGMGNPGIDDWEVVEMTDKEVFTGKLKGK